MWVDKQHIFLVHVIQMHDAARLEITKMQYLRAQIWAHDREALIVFPVI